MFPVGSAKNHADAKEKILSVLSLIDHARHRKVVPRAAGRKLGRRSAAGYWRSWVRQFQDSSARKWSARRVPANFSCIRWEKSSSELRGLWFTTMCWALPAALLATVTMTLSGAP